jgi:hypothetical protein
MYQCYCLVLEEREDSSCLYRDSIDAFLRWNRQPDETGSSPIDSVELEPFEWAFYHCSRLEFECLSLNEAKARATHWTRDELEPSDSRAGIAIATVIFGVSFDVFRPEQVEVYLVHKEVVA